jgi:hypothetical protein
MVRTKEKPPKKEHQEGMSRESLEVAAYFHWLERGCPIGDDLTDWVEVEKKYADTAKNN